MVSTIPSDINITPRSVNNHEKAENISIFCNTTQAIAGRNESIAHNSFRIARLKLKTSAPAYLPFSK